MTIDCCFTFCRMFTSILLFICWQFLHCTLWESIASIIHIFNTLFQYYNNKHISSRRDKVAIPYCNETHQNHCFSIARYVNVLARCICTVSCVFDLCVCVCVNNAVVAHSAQCRKCQHINKRMCVEHSTKCKAAAMKSHDS